MNMKFNKICNMAWNFFRSPRTVAMIKLGVAVIGTIRALEELKVISKDKRRRDELNSDDFE